MSKRLQLSEGGREDSSKRRREDVVCETWWTWKIFLPFHKNWFTFIIALAECPDRHTNPLNTLKDQELEWKGEEYNVKSYFKSHSPSKTNPLSPHTMNEVVPFSIEVHMDSHLKSDHLYKVAMAHYKLAFLNALRSVKNADIVAHIDVQGDNEVVPDLYIAVHNPHGGISLCICIRMFKISDNSPNVQINFEYNVDRQPEMLRKVREKATQHKIPWKFAKNCGERGMHVFRST